MKAVCIDGGATKVAGAIVEQLDNVTFRLNGDIIENRYKDHESFNHNFSSIDIDSQFKRLPINKDEKKQGAVYINCSHRCAIKSSRMAHMPIGCNKWDSFIRLKLRTVIAK